MKVKIVHHTRGHAPGDVVDIDDDGEARRMIRSGRAVPAPKPKKKNPSGTKADGQPANSKEA